jgi:hypothetical protein
MPALGFNIGFVRRIRIAKSAQFFCLSVNPNVRYEHPWGLFNHPE